MIKAKAKGKGKRQRQKAKADVKGKRIKEGVQNGD